MLFFILLQRAKIQDFKEMFNPNLDINQLNNMRQGNMLEHVGIEFIEIGVDYIKAKMPVDHRTVQPLNMLHGGASVVLAETLGSIAAYLQVDPKEQYCVGLEVNANHIKSALYGEMVFGTAMAIHIGKSTHVWEIKIVNQKEELICVSRITMAVKNKKIRE